MYSQHGGSGLCLNLDQIMSLDLSRFNWLLDRLGREREKEAKAIEQASRIR